MMFIEISIGGAPLRPFEGAARNSSVQWRAFRKSGYPVLRKEYAQLNELEHFLKANRIPLCLKMLAARIWAPIRQSGRVVTLLSCFLADFACSLLPRGPDGAPPSKLPTPNSANRPPWHGRRTAERPGSAGPRSPAGECTGDIPE